MNKLTYYIVDVFAERKYAGNQLAVCCGAANLARADMQNIAREFNYSETTFILNNKLTGNHFDVRIFTPKEEVPFAGHPTLGTASIIRNELLPHPLDHIVLKLQAGSIPVTFDEEGYAWMQQLPPVFGQQHDPDVFAGILGIDVAEIDDRFPIEEVSTGLPFFIVPLRSMAALLKASVHRDRYFAFIKHTLAKGILVFCPETHEPQNDLSVRVFVDYYGVPEDPATGSANGCLAGYLVKHRYFASETIQIRSEQGYTIGRPSLLRLKAARVDKHIDISVGGRCITVACGELFI